MKCPVCRVPGFVVEYQRIELDLCAGCQGVWFDRGELELVLSRDRPMQLQPATTEEARRRCPICRKTMDKVNIGPSGGVLIDSCPEGCGLWFDAGELDQLTGDLQQDGWQVAPEVREYLCSLFTPPAGE